MQGGNGLRSPVPEPIQVFFIPFFVPSHIRAMADLACAFASRGVDSTMVITPANGELIRGIMERASGAGHPIKILHYPFPAAEVGLAPGIENVAAASPEEEGKVNYALFIALRTLERLLFEQRPGAVVADCLFASLNDAARDLGIPLLSFQGIGAFPSVVMDLMLRQLSAGLGDANDATTFLVPDIPDRVEMAKSEFPVSFTSPEGAAVMEKMKRQMMESFGLVLSTFYDLEPAYCDRLRQTAFFVGPYSLWSMKNYGIDMGKGDGDQECLAWLEMQETASVVFVAFGSFITFSQEQHRELALGLEASGRPFIWALKEKKNLAGESPALLPEGFEERVRGRGLVLKGWVPQMAILNHRAIGAFVTHMGWNSFTEGLIAGVPMISWPLAYDQFVNERMALNVLKVGIRMWDGFRSVVPEEAAKAVVKAEAISRVVSRFLPPGSADEEVAEMRERAAALRAMMRAAVTEGGAAFEDLTRLIHAIKAFRPEPRAKNIRESTAA